jgi:hypothetical protein
VEHSSQNRDGEVNQETKLEGLQEKKAQGCSAGNIICQRIKKTGMFAPAGERDKVMEVGYRNGGGSAAKPWQP